jgi:hypothetical protein
MSWKRWTNRAEEPIEWGELDPALKQALGDFKASVKAWSDAAYNRPRTVRETVVRRSRQLVAGGIAASLLMMGTLSLGLYEHHHTEVLAKLAVQRAAEEQRQLAAQHALQLAQQEEDMLASVDTDVSREVPSAMDALVRLNDGSDAR